MLLICLGFFSVLFLFRVQETLNLQWNQFKHINAWAMSESEKERKKNGNQIHQKQRVKQSRANNEANTWMIFVLFVCARVFCFILSRSSLNKAGRDLIYMRDKLKQPDNQKNIDKIFCSFIAPNLVKSSFLSPVSHITSFERQKNMTDFLPRK